MNDSLQEKIKKLHLAGILQTADMRVEQAAKEQMSYMEFLELLINDENLNRSRNKRNDLMRRSRIPQHKTIEEFNFSWQPGLKRQVIYGLGTCEFIRKKRKHSIYRAPGNRKNPPVHCTWYQSHRAGIYSAFQHPLRNDGGSVYVKGR